MFQCTYREYPGRLAVIRVGYRGGMSWHTGPLAALDLEATGVDPATDRIVEVALVEVAPDGTATEIVNRLINPGIPMPRAAAEITGITSAELRERGGDPADVLGETLTAIRRFVHDEIPIAIYNAPYDWPLLAKELARYELGTLPGVPPAVIVDPLVLDRHVDRYRKGKRPLAVTAKHYGVNIGGAHRAAADAITTAGVARALAARYPALHLDGTDLVALQIEAYRTWRDDLNEYLARIGADRPSIVGEWPGC
ncbi:DNA polymerase III PolC-type [bacterium BMS3Bbin01]|nr:DNA polymerase III PolC-type [bacterium BMS3Bbin01]